MRASTTYIFFSETDCSYCFSFALLLSISPSHTDWRVKLSFVVFVSNSSCTCLCIDVDRVFDRVIFESGRRSGRKQAFALREQGLKCQVIASNTFV